MNSANFLKTRSIDAAGRPWKCFTLVHRARIVWASQVILLRYSWDQTNLGSKFSVLLLFTALLKLRDQEDIQQALVNPCPAQSACVDPIFGMQWMKDIENALRISQQFVLRTFGFSYLQNAYRSWCTDKFIRIAHNILEMFRTLGPAKSKLVYQGELLSCAFCLKTARKSCALFHVFASAASERYWFAGQLGSIASSLIFIEAHLRMDWPQCKNTCSGSSAWGWPNGFPYEPTSPAHTITRLLPARQAYYIKS